MANIFSIGQSALSVAQAGVNTAGHNIANVNTAGYSRQTVVQVASQAGGQVMSNVSMGAQVAIAPWGPRTRKAPVSEMARLRPAAWALVKRSLGLRIRTSKH